MSSKKFQHIFVSLDVNFNQSLTNDVVSFEQLGPGQETNEDSFGDVFSIFYKIIVCSVHSLGLP